MQQEMRLHQITPGHLRRLQVQADLTSLFSRLQVRQLYRLIMTEQPLKQVLNSGRHNMAILQVSVFIKMPPIPEFILDIYGTTVQEVCWRKLLLLMKLPPGGNKYHSPRQLKYQPVQLMSLLTLAATGIMPIPIRILPLQLSMIHCVHLRVEKTEATGYLFMQTRRPSLTILFNQLIIGQM